jgi:hypothetical protein
MEEWNGLELNKWKKIKAMQLHQVLERNGRKWNGIESERESMGDGHLEVQGFKNKWRNDQMRGTRNTIEYIDSE